MESFYIPTSRLLSNVSDKEEYAQDHTKRKLYGYWQRRKEAWRRRKRYTSKPCRLGFTCLILLWSVLALGTTLLSYFRLINLLQTGYDKIGYAPTETGSLGLRIPDKESLAESDNLASIGAYLIMTSLVTSIILVFSFICLPFDSDKKRLRHKLKGWLCVYFGFIMLVAFCSIIGVALVLIHDKENNHKILCVNGHSRYFEESCYFQNWERTIWSCALIITPFVVLAYHVYFWKNVCLIYDAIDLSKIIIKSDVWSNKV